MPETTIKVDDLSKRYRIGATRGGYRSLRDALSDAVKAPIRRLKNFGKASYRKEDSIWALKDVSFEVERGEVVGVIGKNGAGKTTLLKVLSRITEPTSGRAVLHGRVGSLLQVGTGFHPELTGRENIYLSGTILGMSRKEIDQRFEEIVEFSGIEKYIDTPVKRYSSGMWVRLGFAVAAHLDPEILLIDEVLAVGDAEFQKKCLGKMDDVARGGRTVIFVSHKMGSISRLCDRALWIDNGELMMRGEPEEAISEYLLTGAEEDGKKVWSDGLSTNGSKEVAVSAVKIRNSEDQVTSSVSAAETFYVDIEFEVTDFLHQCRLGFFISKYDGTVIFSTYDSDVEGLNGGRSPGHYEISCEVPGNLLGPGEYTISLDGEVPGIKKLVHAEGVLCLTVEDTNALGSVHENGRQGVIQPDLEWESREIG